MVAVTEKGGRVIDGFRRRRNEVFNDTLSCLSDADRAEVIDAMSKVVAVLDGQEPIAREVLGAPAGLQADPSVRRTATEAPEASNQSGQVPVSLPTKRMRIEWD